MGIFNYLLASMACCVERQFADTSPDANEKKMLNLFIHSMQLRNKPMNNHNPTCSEMET